MCGIVIFPLLISILVEQTLWFVEGRKGWWFIREKMSPQKRLDSMTIVCVAHRTTVFLLHEDEPTGSWHVKKSRLDLVLLV